MEFSQLGLSKPLLEAINDAGYTIPTDIQAQVIPHILEGRDVFGCAQTGTGKTASFLLPLINRLTLTRARARMPRALILEPTRELAAQVADDFAIYSKASKLKAMLLIGGESIAEQEKGLNQGADLLIATPGRFMDLAERGKILLNDIRHLVIDEADRMLDMGFMPDIERIVSLLPRERQTSLFSATMPPAIHKISTTFLREAVEVIISAPSKTAITVQQSYLKVAPRNKRQALRALLRQEKILNAIIFCNRKSDATQLGATLSREGFNAAVLHGGLAQGKRTETLEAFKKGELPLLVASDVAARGLDIDDLPFVINFDVPNNPEDYVHRIGRTGRAGKQGTAFTFVAEGDEEMWKKILKLTGADIAEYKQTEIVPSAEETLNTAPKPIEEGRKAPARRKPTPKPKQEEKSSSPEPQRAPVPLQGPLEPIVGFGDNIPAFLRVSIRSDQPQVNSL